MQKSCTSWRLYRLSAKDMDSLRQISAPPGEGPGTHKGEGVIAKVRQEGKEEIRHGLCLKTTDERKITLLLPGVLVPYIVADFNHQEFLTQFTTQVFKLHLQLLLDDSSKFLSHDVAVRRAHGFK